MNNELKVIRAEQIGWDTFVLVYSNGIRQACSRDTFFQHGGVAA